MKITRKSGDTKILIVVILVIIAVSTLYPVLFMLVNSFKLKVDYMKNPFGLPHIWTIENYISLYKKYAVLRSILNSFVTNITSIVFTVFFVALASFALAKLKFGLNEAFFRFIVSFMMVPVAVLMIPMYIIFSRMGLINNYLSVIIFWFVINAPYGVYLMTANFRAIPTENIESAQIEGADYFRVFISIILPMGRPIIATIIIIYFMWNWNDLLMPMILLQSEAKTTLTVAVATIVGRYSSDLPLLISGLLVNSLPTIIIYLVFQKHLIKGIIAGAIK